MSARQRANGQRTRSSSKRARLEVSGKSSSGSRFASLPSSSRATSEKKSHDAVSDDEEEDEIEPEDDDESKTEEAITLPRKRAKGSGSKSKKRKIESSNDHSEPPSKASCKNTSSKNGTNCESDVPGSSSGLEKTSSKNGINSESADPGLSGLDCEPTNDDLEKFVVNKVPDSGALGIMLHLEMVQIDMIKDEERRVVVRNRRILAQWKEEGTRKPITWRTLISALQDMKMNRLAHQLMEKFGK